MRFSVSKMLLLSSLCFAVSLPVFAQEKAKEEPAKGEKVESVVKAKNDPKEPTGPLKEWIDAENALIDPLSDKDKESFFILRNKYSVIRVVKVVEGDVGNAVKACGKANPDIKEKMDTRFKDWTSAVDPIIDTAKKQLEKDIDAQKIVDPKAARNVMKLNDKAYEDGQKKITKQPVTSKDACEGLLKSMDRTEDNMITLLRETLLPESTIRAKVESEKAKMPPADKKDDGAEKDSKK